MPTTKPSLRDAIRVHLFAHGPSSAEEIHQALLASGATTVKTPSGIRSSLSGSRFAFQLPDHRWDLTTRALAGVVLTVRPRSRLRENVLWVHRDLEPFDGLLTGDTIPLLSGGLARLGGGQIRTLIGPEGWLPGVPPGELLALRWTGAALDVFAVDQPVSTDLAVARDLLRRHLEALAKPYGARPDLATVFISVLREAPELFSTPQVPLSELFPLTMPEVVDTSAWESHQNSRRLTLHLPPRVYDEVRRRAELLGERVEDHAAVLVGAASDRVRVVARSGYEPAYYEFHDDDEDVMRPLRSVT